MWSRGAPAKYLVLFDFELIYYDQTFRLDKSQTTGFSMRRQSKHPIDINHVRNSSVRESNRRMRYCVHYSFPRQSNGTPNAPSILNQTRSAPLRVSIVSSGVGRLPVHCKNGKDITYDQNYANKIHPCTRLIGIISQVSCDRSLRTPKSTS